MPKISIIIPIYNQTKYIRQCLDSCINQTLQDIEIICVDDKSTDDSLEIINEYAQKDSRIKIIALSKNQGPGAARNAGLKIAKGDYLMFLDPDDWYDLTACETAYNQISTNNNDIVTFSHYTYKEEDESVVIKTSNLILPPELVNKPNIKLCDDVSGRYLKSCSVWTSCYKRDLIYKNKITFPNLYHAEDVPFYIKAIVSADNVSVINKPLYYYRFRLDSLTRTRANVYKYFFISRLMVFSYVKKHAKNSLRDAYLLYCISSLLFWYKKETDINVKHKYYNSMHRLFKLIAKKYDLSQYKDEIKYEKYLDIAQNSWNKKHNIYIEIPNTIKLYKNKKDKIVLLLFGKYKFTREKFDKFKKNLKNFIQNIFSIKNTKTHKVISFLGIKLKIKTNK